MADLQDSIKLLTSINIHLQWISFYLVTIVFFKVVKNLIKLIS